MTDLQIDSEESDEQYQSIMRQSNCEAVRDLDLICQKLRLIQATTSSRQANLAKDQAEDELNTEHYFNRVLARSLERALMVLGGSADSLATPLVYNYKAKLNPGYKNLSALDGKTFGSRHRDVVLLCKKIMQPYGIPMYELSTSWRDGHAFCAFIHSLKPELIDEKYLKWKNPKETLIYVETVANSLGVYFDGNFVETLRRKHPDFVKIYFFLVDLYSSLNKSSLNPK